MPEANLLLQAFFMHFRTLELQGKQLFAVINFIE